MARLTPFDVQNAAQAMTMAALQTTDFSDVRVDWQTQGQPAWKVTDDKVFVRAVQVPVPNVDGTRDMVVTQYPDDNTIVSAVFTYMRVWEVGWCFVGPNSFDRAATIKSALYFPPSPDYFNQAGLYPVTEYDAPRRVPELYDGQWWERVDFAARFNELVTETYTQGTATSVEIIVEKENGIKIDFVVGENT